MSGQPRGVDQSDRIVSINLHQSGRTPTALLISTRVRKSPYCTCPTPRAAGGPRSTTACTIRAATFDRRTAAPRRSTRP